jgi:hypothetical protein
MPLQGKLTVGRMCHLAEVSRAGFYRYLQRGWQSEEEVALQSAVQSVVIEHRWRYGYRRVTEELRVRGWIVNHKRTARFMQEDNLLAVRQDWFQPVDDSIRAARIYLNLAKRMTLLGPNQLWVADITYPSRSRIRLSRGRPGRLFSLLAGRSAEASKPSFPFVLWNGRLLIGGHHRESCTIRTKAFRRSVREPRVPAKDQGAWDAAQYEQTCESL